MKPLFPFVLLCIPLVCSWAGTLHRSRDRSRDPCPADPPCTCSGAFIYCDGLNLTEVPQFHKISKTYTVGWMLYLNDNKISKIPSKAFHNFDLRRLTLSGNNITSMADDAFEGVEKNMNILNLSGNDLIYPPQALGILRNLTTFSISENPLLSFNDIMMRNWTSLESLTFGGSGITSWAWPNSLKYLPSLKTLIIKTLGVDFLRLDAFSGLENRPLFIWFQGTAFSEFPQALYTLNSMTDLMITDNVQFTDESFTAHSFDGLNALKSLYLDNTSLTAVPNISTLIELTDLTITTSPISDWDARNLMYPIKLTSLTLDKTNFNRIPTVVSRMANLESISMFQTPLSSVDRSDFTGLGNLTGVAFGYTKLDYIPDDLFHDNPNVKYVDLGHTRVQGVPNALMFLDKLSMLNLDNNTITCTCAELGWMRKFQHVENHIRILGSCSNLNNVSLFEYVWNYVPKC